MAVRDVEAQGASQADSLHQSYAKSIEHLEEQAIEGENKVSLTSYPPVKLTSEPALWNSVAHW